MTVWKEMQINLKDLLPDGSSPLAGAIEWASSRLALKRCSPLAATRVLVGHTFELPEILQWNAHVGQSAIGLLRQERSLKQEDTKAHL